MGHIRSFQAGKNSDLSQRVLNEIATARVCLLSPQRRAAYDQELRRQIEAVMPAATAAVEPPPPLELEVISESLVPVLGTLPIRRTKRRNNQNAWLAVWALGVAAVIIIMAMMVLSGRDDFFGKKIADVEPAKPQSPTRPANASKPKRKETEPTEVVEPEPKKSEITKPRKVSPEEESSVVRPASTEPPNDLGEKIALTSPAPPEKAAVPDDDAQRRALATVRDLYKDDYKAGPADLRHGRF